MNCDQFQQRMDLLLDQRGDLVRDPELTGHAECCGRCRDALDIWSSIDRCIAAQPSPSRSIAVEQITRPTMDLRTSAQRTTRAGWVAAAAAALLIGVTMAAQKPPGSPLATITLDSSMPNSSIANSSESNTAALNSALNSLNAPRPSDAYGISDPLSNIAATHWGSSQWWNSMADEPWVSQTLPAVNSVRIGVAPIGRSMKQAIAILMIRSNQTTLESSRLDPQSPPETPHEQTSTMDRSFGWESIG